MRSGRGTYRTRLWLLASLAFLSLIFLTDGSPMKVMSAPNLLGVGTAQNVFVECQDCTDESDLMVEITVMSYPTKSKRLISTSVNLTSANKFQAFGQIKIPTEGFSRDPQRKQYVYLQAQFPDVKLEKIVLVSFHSGYIFIQTDKTLYTPNSKVHYRLFALTPNMEPVERDNSTISDTSVAIQFVNPEGVIFPLDTVSVKSGIHSGHFQLNEIVSTGLWKVMASFQSKPQLSYSAEFEVKDYVLPNFEVKLMNENPFFYVDSDELTINIKATYLFGEEVDGSAFGVFGVLHQDQKTNFQASLQKVSIENGVGTVTLKKDHIKQTFENISSLVGSSIFAAVNVLTDSGSEMAEAELTGIQIVTSPYTIHFKKTSRYFKPGMSFDVVTEVLNPDGSPAQGVAVMIDPGDVQGFTAANGMARLTINTVNNPQPMKITAKTNDVKISPERQASATMTALPYASQSNSYIHIGVDTAEVKNGQNMKINIHLSRQQNVQNDITYLLLSRGQLVKYGRYRTSGQIMISLIITVTKDLLPSFRIIAYYHPNDNEVVSDSVWVDVEDSCMGLLQLQSEGGSKFYEPRKIFKLKITGDPEATVGLVAVDKGVYILNSKHRLTQKKIWDTVENYDTGCTPGGGKDSMSVFYDAGLLFASNTASGTPYRQELKCLTPNRRKRSVDMMNVTTTLLSQYKDKLEHDCCLDGIRETPTSSNCEKRSEFITDTACFEAFLHCCKEMEKKRAERKEDGLKLARSEDDDSSFMDSNEIVSRTNFPESWLWSDIKLPACPEENANCETESVLRNIPLQDSITTWQLTGISLSKTHGICVGDPLEIVVRKDFFVDLKLPDSAVRGEQLEIKAVIHNHGPNLYTVRVDLTEAEHVCSAASKRGRYRQEMKVGAKSIRSVPFTIIPTKEGQHRIEIKAAVKESEISDGIVKMLRVVPEGILVKSSHTLTLDPKQRGTDGRQVEILNSKIPVIDFVPNSPTSTQISLTGKQQRNVLKNTISGESMGGLIYQPSGCGEENMIHMTLPVIAITYLDRADLWEIVNIDQRHQALQHITTGYRNQLEYSKKDGSFARTQDEPSSTWLTAYVVKVFALANNLIAVQSEVICNAIRFLIVNTQQPNGMFMEVGSVSHKEILGDVLDTDSDASFTAFCVISMQESRTICAPTVHNLQASIDKAVGYLERRLPSLVNPYAVAITSYAMANENKLNREIFFKFSSPDSSYWPSPAGRVFTVEATAYALLALVRAKAFDEARPIVRWFNKQIRENGGYGSAQATMTVYQAIAEYWTSEKEPEYDLNVDILLPGRSKPDKYNFNWENHFATRTSKINVINQDVKVSATGPGEATLTITSLYYELPKEKENNCQKFNLSVQLLPESLGDDENIYNLKIKVFYKNKERNATTPVLDIGLLTGFTVSTKDLDLQAKGHARTISKYRLNTESERRLLTIYLNKVPYTELEIAFRVHQKLKVGILQPASVYVYEFSDQLQSDHTKCVRFYHPERKAGELLRLCRNDECICAEENCSMQKKGKINNDERKDKICETTVRSKIDYAYKVSVEQFADGLSTDIYTVQVLEVIKEGSYDVGAQGRQRTFLGYPHCRMALDLGVGKTFLMMGTSGDIFKDEKSQSYQYVLGERTWIEYWPTVTECTTEEHNSTCSAIDEMVNEYMIRGCRN
ncbi:solute carrier family 38 (sodium-coupled neutral amino acid transporter), member 3 [Sarotherodon galilaeus]